MDYSLKDIYSILENEYKNLLVLTPEDVTPKSIEVLKSNWFVYILYCSDGSLYTGIAKDIKRRVSEHGTSKGAKYTRTRSPVCLVFCELHSDRSEASKREYQVKQLTRQQKIHLVLSNRLLTESIMTYYIKML